MSAYPSRKIHILMAVAAACATSCSREHPSPMAVQAVPLPAAGPTGITLEQARLGSRAPEARSSAGVADAQWYKAAGEPRILILVNRRFATDSELWRADQRVVMETSKGSSLRIINDYEQHDTERERTERRTEKRADSAGDFLPAEMAAGLREGLITPFLMAGCRVIDPDAVERIAQATASREQGASSGRSQADVSADAVRKESDWIMEAAVFPASTEGMPYIIAAKVVDLKTGRVMAYATTRELGLASRLPGTERSAGAKMPPEEQGRWLAREISLKLAAAMSR